MSICWYCYWGWPKVVSEIYQEAEAKINAIGEPCAANKWTWQGVDGESALQYGPAHVVWSDENFNHETIRGCLEDGEGGKNWHDDPAETPEQKEVVLDSLRKLLALPMSVLQPIPEGYFDDDDHPERYPPIPGVEMMKPKRG